ncbi:hypothetical protein [Streptomyces sp. NPDC057426]|uniref:hypothetical protein n=1 Tax=Streptomyces sp. NPDC057426 TaxID=3346128 RepID=UPI00368411B5
MGTFATQRWIDEAEQIRAEAGGYTFESLAVAMVVKLGWSAAAQIAGSLEPFTRGRHCEDSRPGAAELYACLGWEQSVLLQAWFDSLTHFRMVRDEFPGGGGIEPPARRLR